MFWPDIIQLGRVTSDVSTGMSVIPSRWAHSTKFRNVTNPRFKNAVLELLSTNMGEGGQYCKDGLG